jgi:hypothetical protein
MSAVARPCLPTSCGLRGYCNTRGGPKYDKASILPLSCVRRTAKPSSMMYIRFHLRLSPFGSIVALRLYFACFYFFLPVSFSVPLPNNHIRSLLYVHSIYGLVGLILPKKCPRRDHAHRHRLQILYWTQKKWAPESLTDRS